MATDRITIRGEREHPVKSIDLEIPREKLVVITGVSGSGKSGFALEVSHAGLIARRTGGQDRGDILSCFMVEGQREEPGLKGIGIQRTAV